jgi:hypothetical protein
METFVEGELPTRMRRARLPTPEKAAQLGPEIDKVRLRNYVLPGAVSNLTDFFDVPKGDEDTRVVYNGASSGLNEALWAPGFFLPIADFAARLLMCHSFTVDADLGEMFLNFPMDPLIRPFAGVDLAGARDCLTDPSLKGSQMLERWERLFMGMKSSPCNSVRYFHWAEEFGRGNPLDEGNALRCDRVMLNLPGMLDCDPSKANVKKWNDIVDRLTGDIITFVDDLRASGCDRENAWQVARHHRVPSPASRDTRRSQKTSPLLAIRGSLGRDDVRDHCRGDSQDGLARKVGQGEDAHPRIGRTVQGFGSSAQFESQGSGKQARFLGPPVDDLSKHRPFS